MRTRTIIQRAIKQRNGMQLDRICQEEHRLSEKEDREAKHIMESEMKLGKSEEDAKRIAYATVNKQKSTKA